MESLAAYIPMDRRRAMATGDPLPDRAQGAALFADISGYTPLTEALVAAFGPRLGVDRLTQNINEVWEALIAEVHRHGGSVIVFIGDAITCWFEGDDGLRATACALAMQRAMARFARIPVSPEVTISLSIKAAIAAGPARRFRVGDPAIQYFDVLAGATLDRMAAAEKLAEKGEVVLAPEVIARYKRSLTLAGWRSDPKTEARFAVVAQLAGHVTPGAAPRPFPSPADAVSPILSEHQTRPWLLPPVYEQLKSRQEQFLANIRLVVTLFINFSGPDYDRDDEAGAKLDRYVCRAQTVLARYGGHLFKLTTGDKGNNLLAVFGAPLAHDDDASRAVAAALELRQIPPDVDFIEAVKIGLSQGRMLVGAFGGSNRYSYDLIGDEANIAARLMQKAAPGQVMVSEQIAGAAAKSHRFNYLGAAKLKGKRDLLPIFEVVDRALPSLLRPITTFANPLVGREAELAQLEQLLEGTAARRGQVLRLEGDAGLGKSHLAAEFIERAIRRGFQVALGACQSISRDTGYYPWRQVFRHLFELTDEPSAGEDTTTWAAQQIAQVKAIIEDTNPDWLPRLPLLGDLLGLPIPDDPATAAFDPQLRQMALTALSVEIIRTWAAEHPALLVIEDAHWMDEASQELALTLSRSIADVPVLLALVHRPPAQEQEERMVFALNRLPYHHHIALSELSPEGVAVLVSDRLQGRPPPLALELIQAQTQGNPYFVEELVGILREAGHLYLREDNTWVLSDEIFKALYDANCLVKDKLRDRWTLAEAAPLATVELGVPDSVHTIVLSRFDRLPAPHKLTLEVAGVIGRVFEFDLLARSHPGEPGPAPLLEQVRGLEAHDFVRMELPPPRLTYLFKHHISQEVVYQTLPEEQQRELHRAVGQALEQLHPDAVERLAYHYSRSGVRHKTLRYLDKAARKAQAEYANETALTYYNRALALEEHREWRREQIEILHILGRREEEAASLKILAANPQANPVETALLWGRYYESTASYAEAQATVEQALLAGHQTGRMVDRIRCLNQLGLIARRRGDYDDATVWYNQVVNLFQDAAGYAADEGQVLAQALNGLGIVHRQQGRFDEARTCYERALDLYRAAQNRRGEAETLNSLGVTAFYQRAFEAALAYHQEALSIRQTIGDRAGEGISLLNLAQATRDAGDYGQAQQYLRAALNIQQAVGNRWEQVVIWNDMGILFQELGDLPRAESCLQQGLDLCHEIGHKVGITYLMSNLALVMRDGMKLPEAERLLVEGLALVQQQTKDDKYQSAVFLSYLSTVNLQSGKLKKAIQQAEKALAMRRETGLHLLAADDLATLAAAHLKANDVVSAVSYAEKSLAILQECDGQGPEFPQRDYFVCYRVMTAAGQTQTARAALQAACKLVMARADKIIDPALRQSFLQKVAINRQIVAAAAQAGQS